MPVVAGALAVLALAGCASSSPKARLRERLDAVTTAANDRDAAGLRTAVGDFLAAVDQQSKAGDIASTEADRLRARANRVLADADLVDQGKLSASASASAAASAAAAASASEAAAAARASASAAEEQRRQEEARRQAEQQASASPTPAPSSAPPSTAPVPSLLPTAPPSTGQPSSGAGGDGHGNSQTKSKGPGR